MKIYHNPRCRKSRDALALLEDSKFDFSTIHYLKDPLQPNELKEILEKLEYSPMELIRTNEKEWKTDYKGKAMSDSELIDLMCIHPKLMERPIIVTEKGAVVGRPLDRLEEFIKNL